MIIYYWMKGWRNFDLGFQKNYNPSFVPVGIGVSNFPYVNIYDTLILSKILVDIGQNWSNMVKDLRAMFITMEF